MGLQAGREAPACARLKVRQAKLPWSACKLQRRFWLDEVVLTNFVMVLPSPSRLDR
jgi:hypothetical protein